MHTAFVHLSQFSSSNPILSHLQIFIFISIFLFILYIFAESICYIYTCYNHKYIHVLALPLCQTTTPIGPVPVEKL